VRVVTTDFNNALPGKKEIVAFPESDTTMPGDLMEWAGVVIVVEIFSSTWGELFYLWLKPEGLKVSEATF